MTQRRQINPQLTPGVGYTPTAASFRGPVHPAHPAVSDFNRQQAFIDVLRRAKGLGAGGPQKPPPGPPPPPPPPPNPAYSDVDGALQWLYNAPVGTGSTVAPPQYVDVVKLGTDASGLFNDVSTYAPGSFTLGGAFYFGWATPGVGNNSWQTIYTDTLAVVSTKSALGSVLYLARWATQGDGFAGRVGTLTTLLTELKDKRNLVQTMGGQITQLVAQIGALSNQINDLQSQLADAGNQVSAANAAAAAAAAICIPPQGP